MEASEWIYRGLYRDQYRALGELPIGPPEWTWQDRYDLWVAAGYRPGMSILDYGCGWGIILNAIEDWSTYLGVDICPEVIELGRSKFPGADFRVLDDLGTLDCGVKDFVVAHSVFTHTPRELVAATLQNIKRALGGIGLVDIIEGRDNPEEWLIRKYREDEWLERLRLAGLQANKLKEAPRCGYPMIYYKVTHA